MGPKKQSLVTLSSTESEYVTLTHGTKECIGLKQLFVEHGMDVGKITVHEDNQAAQHLAEGKGVRQRSRHIDVLYHWTREQIKKVVIELRYCPTAVMVVDHFTKPLAQPKFDAFVKELGMCRVGVLEQQG
ncbi:unnamed protein product [Phytophthora fragariaefolia]|uniref:Unnamed protein product n=1 Tax=Phytophthora fragariaefolia TaxID=1490495 RepID=A0A9W6XPC1_9STRA|nr:unnamed protein product [Phytophthora fragariaefolia]